MKAKWLHVNDFVDIVHNVWGVASRDNIGSWSDKVGDYGRILDHWGKHTFKNIHSRLRWLMKQLKRLRWMVQSFM